MILCNEGERARKACERVKAASSEMVILHDGEANLETKNLAASLGVPFYEYEKKGCKEPHLVRFFSENAEEPKWYLHVDSDEILSQELVEEILSLDLDKPEVYYGELVHTKSDGTALRYSENSSRSEKPVIFHSESFEYLIGMPHCFCAFKSRPKRLNNPTIHEAAHLDYGLFKILSKEARFAQTDARIRTNEVAFFSKGKLDFVSPSASILGKNNYYRYKYSLLVLFPAMLYSLKRSFGWLFEARSLSAFVVEARLLVARPFYQGRICWLIAQNKRSA